MPGGLLMSAPAAVLDILVYARTQGATSSLTKLERTLQGSAKTADASAKRIEAYGNSISKVGRSATRNVSLPAAAIAAASVKLATDFNQSMEMIHTQAGATQSEVNKLHDEILNLAASGKVTQGPNDLSQALYRLEGAGLRGAKAMSALKQSAHLATVGNADLEDTAKTLAQTWFVGIKGAGNFNNVVGELNATVGAGDLRLSQLVDALGTGVLPAAKQAGLSLQDVTGALAVFGDETNNVSGFAAQFATALHFLTNPSDKAKNALDSINLSQQKFVRDLQQPHGLLLALTQLRNQLETLPGGAKGPQAQQILGDILPGGRGRVLLVLMNQLDRYQGKLDQIKGTQAQFGSSVKKSMDLPANQLRADLAKLEAEAVVLGEQLTPPVTALAGDLTTLLGLLGQIPHATELLIGAMVFGPVLRSIGATITAYGQLNRVLIGTGETASGGFASSLARGLGPAIAAAGIGDVITTAVQGDTDKAMVQGGGLLAGALVGGIVGGLPGAMVGAGVGDVLGHLLGSQVNTDPFHNSVDAVTKALAGASRAAKAYDRAQSDVHDASQRVTRTTDAQHQAEQHLLDVRRKYGPDSQQAIKAENDLARATRSHSTAVKSLQLAERVSAAERGIYETKERAAANTVMRDLLHEQAVRRSILKQEAQARASGTLTRKEELDYGRRLSQVNRLAAKDQKDLNDIQIRAGKEIGPKFANSLGDLTDKLKKYRDRTDQSTGAQAKWTKQGVQLALQAYATSKGLKVSYGELDHFASRAIKSGDATKYMHNHLDQLGHAVKTSGDDARKWAKQWGDQLDRGPKAMNDAVGGMLKELGKLPPGVAKIAGQAALNQIQAARQAGTISGNTYSVLRKTVLSELDKLKSGATKESNDTKQNVTRATGQTSSTVSHDFHNMNQTAVQALGNLVSNANSIGKAMGISQEIKWSSTSGSAHNKPTSHARQQGGIDALTRVPGQGTGDKVPVHVAGKLFAYTEPGELLGVMNQKAAAEWMAWNSAVPRFAEGGVRRMATGGMAAMVAEANKFESHHFPYVLGGGHGSFGIQPVDCSGAVSDVLHAAGLLNAPMVSGSLMNWGKSGKGPLTVYANPEHTFMSLDGRYFGTSGSNPAGGAGWVEGGYPASYLSGFAARTMDVKGALEQVKRILLEPQIAMGAPGQAMLDKARKEANNWLSKHQPAGAFGGGQALQEMFKGGKTVAASWYGGPPGTRGGSGHVLDSHSFAELGWSGGSETAATGLGGLPYGAKVQIGYKGKSMLGEKWDVGAGGGGVGGFPRAVDLWVAMADAIGFDKSAGLDLIQVKSAQEGGFIDLWGNGMAHLAKGGALHIPKHLRHLTHVDKARKRRHDLDGLIHKIKGLGLGQHQIGHISDLDTQVQTFEDLAQRASDITGDGLPQKVPGPGGDLDQAGWLGKELNALWKLRGALITAQDQIKRIRDRIQKQTDDAEKRLHELKREARHASQRIHKLRHGRQLSKSDLDDMRKDKRRVDHRISDLGDKKHLSKAEHDELRHLKVANKLRERALSSGKEPLSNRLQDLLASLQDDQKARSIQVDALSGDNGIIPALRDRRGKLSDTLSNFMSLDDIQGIGSTKDLHTKLMSPVDHRFGGQLLSTQLALVDLGKPSGSALDGLDVASLVEFSKLVQVGAFATDAFGTVPKRHGGGMGGYGYSVPDGTRDVLRRLLPEEGVIDGETMNRGLSVAPAPPPVLYADLDIYVGDEKIASIADQRIELHAKKGGRTTRHQVQAKVRLPA